MPYKCVNCSKIYDDIAKEVSDGCECKSRFFFYISEEKLRKIEEEKEKTIKLTAKEKKQIEEDVREISGVKNTEKPVYLDFESIKVIKPGKYSVNIDNLFSVGNPRVYRLEDGKYIVDLSPTIDKSN